jgi:hypothetical protein
MENVNKLRVILLLIFSLGFFTSCGDSDKEPLPTSLKAEDLSNAGTPGLVDEGAFKKPVNAKEADTFLSGTVSFEETPIISTISNTTYRGSGRKLFPAFSVSLLSDGGIIIPVETRLIASDTGIISTWANGNSYWDVVIGAGAVWQQDGDDDWYRASFPVSLVSRQDSRMKNCTAIFLYNAIDISSTYLQCSQESSPPSPTGQIADIRVLIPTRYAPETFSNTDQLLDEYRTEVDNRLSVQDWSLLGQRSNNLRLLFNRDLQQTHKQSLGAFVIDDVIFRQIPLTRNGYYPYPDEMRYGVASVTKSALSALSLLYLAQRYGESIFDALITDYVPSLSDHPGWRDVTFYHTLNMVVGTVSQDSSTYLGAFYQAYSADENINAIAQFASNGDRPGAVLRYASTNTFVLSYAMQKYVESIEGPTIYYWDLVKDNVLKPIGITRLAVQHTRESDSSQGVPIMAWGAYPTMDEIAKIAKLFANDGRHHDIQLLHLERTRESMSKTNWAGYAATRGRHYKNSFWSINVFRNCNTTLTYMAGNGGNFVGFLPSGMIFIRFTDGEYNDPTAMAVASESYSDSCN